MKNKTIFEWAEMFQEQIQNGASQSDIVQMLDEYGKQALSQHNVIKNELTVCESDCHKLDIETYGICHACGLKA